MQSICRRVLYVQVNSDTTHGDFLKVGGHTKSHDMRSQGTKSLEAAQMWRALSKHLILVPEFSYLIKQGSVLAFEVKPHYSHIFE
jgi:hypothetical protein